MAGKDILETSHQIPKHWLHIHIRLLVRSSVVIISSHKESLLRVLVIAVEASWNIVDIYRRRTVLSVYPNVHHLWATTKIATTPSHKVAQRHFYQLYNLPIPHSNSRRPRTRTSLLLLWLLLMIWLPIRWWLMRRHSRRRLLLSLIVAIRRWPHRWLLCSSVICVCRRRLLSRLLRARRPHRYIWQMRRILIHHLWTSVYILAAGRSCWIGHFVAGDRCSEIWDCL